jgi:hypothetical protein
MRRIVLALVVLGACGGTQIPLHSGYKSDKAKPWKKPKLIALDEKGEGKAEGDLNYGQYKRAKWFSIDLPANGELDLRLEINPPGDAANEDFDLAMEVLDPGYRVISKSDLEDEDAHELNKVKTLYDLAPGKYFIHLYLQGRMDSADFALQAVFKRTAAAEVKSDFPAKVAFLPALPMVPVNDDTPKNYEAPKTKEVKIKKPIRGTGTTVVTTPVKPTGPAPTAKPTRIIGLSVGANGTIITVGIGTKQEVANGWHATIAGVSGSFALQDCTETFCKINAGKTTSDQIKAGGGNVTVAP